MTVAMASRASVRWFWRDIRMVYVLLVWAAFGTGLFFYFDSGISFHGAASAKPAAQVAGDDELYTGSIIVVSRSGDDCWKMMLDNRTGRMWENGYVDCGVVSGVLAAGQEKIEARVGRLHAIGAAFRDGR